MLVQRIDRIGADPVAPGRERYVQPQPPAPRAARLDLDRPLARARRRERPIAPQEPAAATVDAAIDAHEHADDSLGPLRRRAGECARTLAGRSTHHQPRVGGMGASPGDPGGRTRRTGEAQLLVRQHHAKRGADARRAARLLADRQAKLNVAHRDRERAVRRSRVGGVAAQQLELCNVAGGEVPGARVKLEKLYTVRLARVDPVDAAGYERLLVRSWVDVPQARSDLGV